MTGPVDALAHEVRLAEAADRARAGDHAAALAALDGVPADHPGRLDLAARVHAQRGEYAAAEAAWRRVLEQRPDDAAALAGCALVARITAGRRRRRPVPLTGVAVSVAVVGAAVAVAVLPSAAVLPSEVADRTPPPVTRVEPSTSTPDPVSLRLDALAAALAAPGVVVERRAADVRVAFAEGLFAPDATVPTPAGREALARWAAALTGRDVRVTVLGHTAAVPGEAAAGGSEVALARAAEAAEVVAAASGLPLTSFAVASADQSDAPHPPAEQPRNRTVTVLVAEAGR
ncbi:hypothetical protein [Saccharothrix hoggarensis]